MREVAPWIPGFVNAHCHAFQRALRGRTEGGDFWAWRETMLELAAAQNARARPARVRRGLPRTLGRGLHGRRRVPLPRARRGACGGGGCRRGGDRARPPPRRLRSGRDRPLPAGVGVRVPARLPPGAASRARRASASPPTWSRACPREWLEELGRYAAEHELPLHVHADEQPREIEECLAEHGLRPIELLDACGCLGPRTTVVHATHADGHELDLLAAAGARVCACPTTEANLGDGFLPVERLLHRGIELCIGSDSNVRIDPLEELRELDGIARRQSGRRECSRSIGCSRSVRQAGATALGLDAWPDAAVDVGHPQLAGVEDWRSALVAGCSADVLRIAG